MHNKRFVLLVHIRQNKKYKSNINKYDQSVYIDG
jgi:hypothetical protein